VGTTSVGACIKWPGRGGADPWQPLTAM
jgi:hypothetical protein